MRSDHVMGIRNRNFWHSSAGRVLASLAVSIVLCAIYVVMIVFNSEMEFRPLSLLIFLSLPLGAYLRHRLKM